jgi:hypothetical protein
MIEALLLAVVAAFADMVRGGIGQWMFPGKLNLVRKPVCMMVIALIISSTMPWSNWNYLFIVWFGLIGWRAGTGDPMGKAATSHTTVRSTVKDYWKNLEWWQWTDNAWWSLVTLGLIWTWVAIPVAVITENYNWLYVPILYCFSFPFAGILSRKVFEGGERRWIAAEGLRSGIFMFFFKAGL